MILVDRCGPEGVGRPRTRAHDTSDLSRSLAHVSRASSLRARHSLVPVQEALEVAYEVVGGHAMPKARERCDQPRQAGTPFGMEAN